MNYFIVGKNNPGVNNVSFIIIKKSKVAGHLTHNFNSAGSVANSQAGALILSNLQKQAFVQAINDDFLIAAAITIIIIIPILFLRTAKKKAQADAADHIAIE